MECSQAEIYIMQHFDKTIKPKNAQKLAKHILTCENCRELYFTMDEAAEFAEATDFTEAPEGFAESVMKEVRRVAPAIPEKKEEKSVLRLVWGFCALIMAVCMFVMQDLTRLTNRLVPLIDSISGFNISIDYLGFTALLLVVIMSVLLYVLNNEESAKA